MVVAESGAKVKTVLATELPGEPCAGFFVYYDISSDWSYGSGVIVKRSVEVCPS